jgi:hypothetical protein
MKHVLFIWILGLIYLSSLAQTDSLTLVKYDFSYEFPSGIYLDFNDFKKGNVVPFSRTNLSHEDFSDIELALLEMKNVDYYDSFGNFQTVVYDNIWGYVESDKLFVYWGGGFHLVPYIGSISHFVAQVLVSNNRMNEPFYDPYYYYTGPSSFTSIENFQLIMDFESGQILNFDEINVAKMIKSDDKLFNEYMSLSKRKKRKLMFYFIRQYNDKHPIYLPKVEQ